MRRQIIVAATMAATLWGGTPVRGDGMLIGPSWLLQGFSEQAQVAVVAVGPDRAVAVDLFISLLDTSGQPHEVHFLLPLQTMPGEFSAREVTLRGYREKLVDPLDILLLEAAASDRRQERSIGKMHTAGSLLAGPCALMARVVLDRQRRRGAEMAGGVQEGGSERATPAFSVATEHAQVEVYEALEPAELAALAEVAELPEAAGKALPLYVGEPFALMRLRTVVQSGGGARRRHADSQKHPGLHLRFTQKMLRHEEQSRRSRAGLKYYYDYPLGTGQAWGHPIPLTQVYVTAPEDLNLSVHFPQRPSARVLATKGMVVSVDESLSYAAARRQVHAATYEDSNPREDVRVLLDTGEKGEFALANEIRERRLLAARVGFPVLGLFAWMFAFLVVCANGRYAKEAGVWRALGASWVVAYGLLLIPLLGLRALWMWSKDVPPRLWLTWLAGDPESFGRVLLHVSVWVLALTALALILRAIIRRPTPRTRDLLARAMLAGAIAGGIYAVLGGQLAVLLLD